MVDKKLEELSEIYQVGFDRFSYAGLEAYDKEKVIDRGYGLLTNSNVKELLLRSKEEVFSREDSSSPEERFQEVIHSVVRFAGYFDNSQEPDFSNMNRYIGMIKKLNSYTRKGEKATKHSREIQDGLNTIFLEYSKQMKRMMIRPSVYGSSRYGDAGPASDIDMNFLVSGGVTQEKVDLMSKIEINIDLGLGFHQIRDCSSVREMIVDLDELNAVLLDIVDGETTCLEDYSFNEVEHYPFAWLLEGKSFAGPLDEIDAETKLIKRQIDTAIKKDPFFEFLVNFGLYKSIEKREENLKRE